jgi:peptidoglycan/xylan/chitin deacetylase (PgdA/CDA1 family)
MLTRISALLLSLAVRGFDVTRDRARRWLGRQRMPNGIVLYYHAVQPHQRQQFARQMDEVLKRALPFPAGSPGKMTPGAANVAVTFDDGFRSVVENAVPELEKRGIPFTLFVPTGCLGERPSWVRNPAHPFWNERVLSAGELGALARNPLATLASHSVTHPNLAALATANAADELLRSKDELQQASGSVVDLFSFPHGAFTADLVDLARQAGYRHAFTIEPTSVEPRADAFTVGRVAADPADWPLEFRLKLSGAYRWRASWHRITQRVRSNGNGYEAR